METYHACLLIKCDVRDSVQPHTVACALLRVMLQ